MMYFIHTLLSSPSGTWTSISKAYIGSTSLTYTTTHSYVIPYTVPSSAREVLIYGIVAGGYAGNNIFQDIKIFTQEGTTRYKKYLYMHSWSQDAWNTNSDNMWFPMPSNRRILMTVSRNHGGNGYARLYAIGYR